MRLSEFWLLAHGEFGRAYAETLAADLVLAPLDATAAEALEAGVPPRTVWQHLCDAMDVPEERRAGPQPADRRQVAGGAGTGRPGGSRDGNGSAGAA